MDRLNTGELFRLWGETLHEHVQNDLHLYWMNLPDAKALSRINYLTCLKFCSMLMSGRELTLFQNSGDTAVGVHAEGLSRSKEWSYEVREFQRLDLAVLNAERPYALEFAAEVENSNIIRKPELTRAKFVNCGKRGLSDFTKLLLAPARIRVYIGRTMRQAKKSIGRCEETKAEFRRLVIEAIEAGRSVKRDDKIAVLLVYLRQKKVNWPDDCVVGLGQWDSSKNDFLWTEGKPS